MVSFDPEIVEFVHFDIAGEGLPFFGGVAEHLAVGLPHKDHVISLTDLDASFRLPEACLTPCRQLHLSTAT
jgi:hypothetical protein